MSRRDTTRGLTLIELVVAMAVFALVAVMGLQALSGMLRQRDRAADHAGASAALGQAAGLIRHDLGAVMPVLFYPPEGRAQSALTDLRGQSGFALTVANTRPYAPLGATGLMTRVEYRFDAETGGLYRREWRSAWPATAAERGPEVLVLDGVQALGLRSYWTGLGWIDGLRFAALDQLRAEQGASTQDAEGSGPESYSDQLPLAVEITLTTTAFGTITLIESPS
ncbi:MAG: type II secretion system protein GspJ [Paracoccaceae bacterium]